MNILQRILINFLVFLMTIEGGVGAELVKINRAHAVAPPVPTVVINEVMWMGSTASSADEWIELYNTSATTPVDLTNWTLTPAAPSSGTLTIPAGLSSIPAHGYFMIANYDPTKAADTGKTVLNFTADWVTSNISLSDSCVGSLVLKDSESTPVVSDTVSCSGLASNGHWDAGVSGAVNRSMERKDPNVLGTLTSNWQSSCQQLNLKPTTKDSASPNAANGSTVDLTPPTDGTTNATPSSYFDHATGLSADWTGFSDPDSGVCTYNIGLGDNSLTANIIPFQAVANYASNLALVLLSPLTENTSYYVLVQAVNGAGLKSDIINSGPVIFRETTPPDPYLLTSAIDTPSDNGGSINVAWNSSSSDVTNYQVQYQTHGGSWLSPSVKDAGLNLNTTISGLQNTPASYDFRVVSTSFNGLKTFSTNLLTGQALDNLAPVIDPTKITVGQNKPGTNDTLTGQSGTSNEPNIIADIYFQDPAVTPTSPVTMTIGADGGFTAALSIGDNLHDKIWVKLFDGVNFSATTPIFTNDIIGPIPPTLTKATTNCTSDNCVVNLDWQAGSIDTASYKVTYITGGVTHQTFEITLPALALDLPSGQSYQFFVTGYDQSGNPSVASNIFSLTLTKGVKTTVTLVNNQPTTTTEAIPGALEVTTAVIPKTIVSAQIIPQAEAATPTPAPVTTTSEPTPDLPNTPTPITVAPVPKPAAPSETIPKSATFQTLPEPTPQADSQPLVQSATASNDWIRIFVVIVLLLIITGSFYALSRSVQDTPEEAFDKAKRAKPGRVLKRGRRGGPKK